MTENPCEVSQNPVKNRLCNHGESRGKIFHDYLTDSAVLTICVSIIEREREIERSKRSNGDVSLEGGVTSSAS